MLTINISSNAEAHIQKNLVQRQKPQASFVKIQKNKNTPDQQTLKAGSL